MEGGRYTIVDSIAPMCALQVPQKGAKWDVTRCYRLPWLAECTRKEHEHGDATLPVSTQTMEEFVPLIPTALVQS